MSKSIPTSDLRSRSSGLLAAATARLDVRKALRVLQAELRRRFDGAYNDIGNNTLSITPDRIELTDERCTIVARGPARVATVLVRRRRTPAHARDRAPDRPTERKAK